MFLVIRPAQTAGQLQVGCDIVIDFAEGRIGIERVWILTQEIIVTFIVEDGDRIGV